MTPEEIRKHAAWLCDLSGSWDEPIETASDLRSWAWYVHDHDDDITVGDQSKIYSLIKVLDEVLETSAERAERKRREKKRAQRLAQFNGDELALIVDECKDHRDKIERLQSQGTASRKREGTISRNAIISKYQSLGTLPERSKAGRIARSLNLSRQYVGRVLKTSGLK